MSWGKKVKKIAPKLNEIMIEGKIFVLREDGVLVLKSKYEVPPK